MARRFKMFSVLALAMACVFAILPTANAGDKVAEAIAEASQLSDMEAYKYFTSLKEKGLTDDEIIRFFVNLPISEANKQAHDLYFDDALDIYAESAPDGVLYENFAWEKGMGTEIVGPFTGQEVKAAYTDYLPVPAGPIGDPNRKYKIGAVVLSMYDSWIGNLHDSIAMEANRHENLEMTWMDYVLDSDGMADAIDTMIAQKVDAILLWPRSEAPSGPPAKRAVETGIPVVTVDRLCGYEGITGTVSGNFPANGAQTAAYLAWKLGQESGGKAVKGNVVLLRKAAGVTADTLRAGPFLRVISYFPGINILNSYFDNDDREQAYTNAQNALQSYDNIDAFFCEGLTQTPVAVEAVKNANRWKRQNGEQMIMLAIDDTKETFDLMKRGYIEVDAPYTPLIGDIAIRMIIKILEGAEMPKDIAIPNIPIITMEGDVVFGLQTQTMDQWYQYASGPPYEGE